MKGVTRLTASMSLFLSCLLSSIGLVSCASGGQQQAEENLQQGNEAEEGEEGTAAQGQNGNNFGNDAVVENLGDNGESYALENENAAEVNSDAGNEFAGNAAAANAPIDAVSTTGEGNTAAAEADPVDYALANQTATQAAPVNPSAAQAMAPGSDPAALTQPASGSESLSSQAGPAMSGASTRYDSIADLPKCGL